MSAGAPPSARRGLRRSPPPRLLPRLLAGVALAVLATVASAGSELAWRWSGVDRVVVIGDVHGAYESLVHVLRSAGLVSERLAWSGGEAHLVMLGDLVDRGARSREALDLIRRLQEEAPEAGGRVHMVLGNHEVMNMVGDLRYAHPAEFAAFADEETLEEREAGFERWLEAKDRDDDDPLARQDFETEHPRGWYAHRRAFSPTGEYGRWLLGQRILVMVNDTVYLHGGLAPCLLDHDPDAINDTAMTELREVVEAFASLTEAGVMSPETAYPNHFRLAKAYIKRWRKVKMPKVQGNVTTATRAMGNLHTLTLRNDGPLWYRGSSLNPAEEELEIATSVLDHLGAARVVVGHTPTHTGRIAVRLDGKVIRADTGMLTSYYHGQASAVVADGSNLYELYPREGASPLGPWVQPPTAVAADDSTVEEILASAEIIAREDVGAGVTRPQRLTLARDGQTWRAIFKTTTDLSPLDATDATEIHHHRYEVAAYIIDRELGFGLVPPAVLRQIGTSEGSLQLWVEDAINAVNREQEDLQPSNPEAFQRQLDLIPLFDTLIYNPIRQPTNILITTHDWQIHLIDHSSAFAPLPTSPPDLADQPLELDLEVVNALLRLEPESLSDRLDGILTQNEIDAVLARRDLILAPWRKPEPAEATAVAAAGL